MSPGHTSTEWRVFQLKSLWLQRKHTHKKLFKTLVPASPAGSSWTTVGTLTALMERVGPATAGGRTIDASAARVS